jgi:chromosome segregation ATPase
MSYRTALQALAAYENPHFLTILDPASQAAQQVGGSHSHAQGKQQQQQQQRRTLQVVLDEVFDQQRYLEHTQRQLQDQISYWQADLEEQQIARDRLLQDNAAAAVSEQQQQLQRDKLAAFEQVIAQRVGKIAELQRQLAATLDKLLHTEQQLRPLQEQQQQWEVLRQVLLDDLVDCKYHLVVSSQNLGVFASKQESKSNMKSAWLAHSVEVLRNRHPTFKVCPATTAHLHRA